MKSIWFKIFREVVEKGFEIVIGPGLGRVGRLELNMKGHGESLTGELRIGRDGSYFSEADSRPGGDIELIVNGTSQSVGEFCLETFLSH